jgi:hypothetical protein
LGERYAYYSAMSKITFGRTCEWCGDYFTAERDHARFCSDSHRVAWHRLRAQHENRSTSRLRSTPAAGQSVTETHKITAGGSPNPAEVFRVLGMSDDSQRVRDRLAAFRDREKVDRASPARRVGQLASAILKARRHSDLCFQDWKASPSRARLDEVESANRSRNMLEQELRDLLLGDETLITAVLQAARG